MQMQKIFLLAGAISTLLCACATPTKNSNEYMPTSPISRSEPKIRLSLGKVTLGYTPQNLYEGEMARKALQDTLVESNLFDANSLTTLNVTVTKMVLDGDKFGFEMTARAIGEYSVTTEAGGTVFQTSIHSQGKADPLEAYVGTERLSIASRRAIAANFSSLVEEMSQFIEKRRENIEAMAIAKPVSPSPKSQAPQAPQAPVGKSIFSGTGFLINTQGHILTNQHVVNHCSGLTARLPDGTTNAAQIVASDSWNDLAVVRVSAQVNSVATFNETSGYRQGDHVVVYGFPLAGALALSGNLTTGTLSALTGLGNDTRYLQISAPVQAGNSGGPLADDTGNIIGVVTSKLNIIKIFKVTGDIPQNVNFAVKDVVAKSFLQSHNIPFSQRNRTSHLSAADIGDDIKSYVVYLQCFRD